MAKKKRVPSKPRTDPGCLTVQEVPGEKQEVTLARQVIQPSVQAAATLQQLEPGNDLGALVAVLGEQVDVVGNGDLSRPEAILLAQATTLDALAHKLMRRAMNAEYLEHFATYLRLGLRAQNQCRSTLETLAEIKHPKAVAFVARASFAAGGNQQVNIGPSRAGEIKNEQSKLLERNDEERLDSGAAGKAGEADKRLEAVGEGHGTQNG